MISRAIQSEIVARSISMLFPLLILFWPGLPAVAKDTIVLHVPSDHPTIQQAIDAAPLVDAVIIVAPGTYHEAIDTSNKNVHLRSSDGPEATTIDASGLESSAVMLTSGKIPEATVEGFTITGGQGSIVHGTDVGGGGVLVDQVDATIIDCIIVNNSADVGGGLWNAGGTLTVEDSVIKSNTADTGGGVFHASPMGTITGTTIADNGADQGGGVYVLQSHFIMVGDSFFCGNDPDDIGGGGAWKDLLGNEFVDSCEVTYNVPGDFAGIQDAIDATPLVGAEIIVAPGTYNQPINTNGKAVHLRSEEGPEHTIIDASGFNTHAITVWSGEGPDTIIEGFTVTGGNPSGSGGGLVVLSSSPTVIDCVFENNASGLNGGGIRISAVLGEAHVEFLGNTVIKSNTAVGFGGGLSVDQGACVEIFGELHVEDNTTEFGGGGIALVDSDVTFPGDSFITNNSAEVGGGIAISGGTTEFPGDTFVELNEAEFGGGVAVLGGNINFPGDSFITNNTADTGGGIAIEDGTIEFPGDSFVDNNEAVFGGGIHVGEDGTVAMHDLTGFSTIMNNIATQGGGLYNEGEALIEDGLFENNQANAGGGVYNANGGTLSVHEMEFIGNSSGDDSTLLTATGGAIASDDEATTEVENSVFCLNTPDDITGPWNDLGGNTFSASADLNCDGVVDVFDLLILLENWGTCSDPADCPADLNGDSVIDVFDLLLLLENWG